MIDASVTRSARNAANPRRDHPRSPIAHGGAEVSHTGDGMMATFGSATAAVACAIDIQRAFTQHNSEHPEVPIRVRIGLNAGEPIADTSCCSARRSTWPRESAPGRAANRSSSQTSCGSSPRARTWRSSLGGARR